MNVNLEKTSEVQARMRMIGDNLQSEASRVAEWVRESNVKIPYEVHMAVCGIEQSVEAWTELRKSEAR